MSVFLFASRPAFAALEITNQKTAEHVGVPGMNAHFAPAPGLKLASAFDGFESRARRVEVIVANIAAPFPVIEDGFTESSFKSGGMQMMSRGDFMVNGARGVLFKVMHPDGETKWGKWVMLVENGQDTLVVNAAFVSGDAQAASDLERMLKSVYLAPVESARSESEISLGTPEDGSASADMTPSVPPAASKDSRQGAAGAESVLRSVSRDISVSFDKKEALSNIVRDITASADAAPERENILLSPDVSSIDASSGDESAVSGDRRTRRNAVRIITEEGIVTSGDASAEPAPKTEKREPRAASEDAGERAPRDN
jgi:hypothetical protein